MIIAGIKIHNLCKSYYVSGSEVAAVQNIEMKLDAEEITVIIGKSGCGKTTLLRLLAGLEESDSGSIEMDHNRKIGIVFQEPRLMDWLTVGQNVAFSSRSTDKNLVKYYLEMIGLENFAQAYPFQLSGGMKQRAALARTMVYEPDVILMDEPFAALDSFTREALQKELLKIYHATKKQIIFVTHSIEEALVLGHSIAVLEKGKLRKQVDLRSFPFARDIDSIELIKKKREIKRLLEDIVGNS